MSAPPSEYTWCFTSSHLCLLSSTTLFAWRVAEACKLVSLMIHLLTFNFFFFQSSRSDFIKPNNSMSPFYHVANGFPSHLEQKVGPWKRLKGHHVPAAATSHLMYCSSPPGSLQAATQASAFPQIHGANIFEAFEVSLPRSCLPKYWCYYIPLFSLFLLRKFSYPLCLKHQLSLTV